MLTCSYLGGAIPVVLFAPLLNFNTDTYTYDLLPAGYSTPCPAGHPPVSTQIALMFTIITAGYCRLSQANLSELDFFPFRQRLVLTHTKGPPSEAHLYKWNTYSSSNTSAFSQLFIVLYNLLRTPIND